MPRRQILSLALAFIILLAVSPSVAIAQSENLVDLAIEPSEITGDKGGTFQLAIKAIPNGQKLAAIDVFLDFDPAYLEVVDFNPDKPGVQIDPGTTLTFLMAAEVDNSNGMITHSGIMPPGRESPDDAFTVANITFRIKANAAAGTTKITFHTQTPRNTIVAYKSNSILGLLSGATVTVGTASVPALLPEETESSPPPTSESSSTPPSEEVPESAETPEPTTVTDEADKTATTTTEETELAPAPDSSSAPTATTTPGGEGAPLTTPEIPAGFIWWILLIIALVVAAGLGGFIIARRRA
ncbi:hypothetical protein ES703_123754 [subsurface metagenome]